MAEILEYTNNPIDLLNPEAQAIPEPLNPEKLTIFTNKLNQITKAISDIAQMTNTKLPEDFPPAIVITTNSSFFEAHFGKDTSNHPFFPGAEFRPEANVALFDASLVNHIDDFGPLVKDLLAIIVPLEELIHASTTHTKPNPTVPPELLIRIGFTPEESYNNNRKLEKGRIYIYTGDSDYEFFQKTGLDYNPEIKSSHDLIEAQSTERLTAVIREALLSKIEPDHFDSTGTLRFFNRYNDTQDQVLVPVGQFLNSNKPISVEKLFQILSQGDDTKLKGLQVTDRTTKKVPLTHLLGGYKYVISLQG